MITYAPLAEDLLPISLATLPLTSTVGVNVYLKTRPGEPPLLFSAAHNPISRSHFEELILKGSDKLFIHRRDRDLYRQAVKDCWQTLLLDRSLPLLQRLAAVNELTRESMAEKLAVGDTEHIVSTSRQWAASCVAVLGDDEVSLSALADRLHTDCTLATHVANVSLFATLLGRELGYVSQDLEHLAAGALLHDLGMLDVEPIVLNKPGRLQDDERRLIQGHPGLGLQRVIQRCDLPEGSMMMIYQHHERMNGSGYPVGLSGNEIHPWSRLCSIVDVYVALTSHRPQRQALVSPTALAVLDRGTGSEFDQEIVTCWRRLLLN